MNCVLCFHVERQHHPNGECPEYKPGKNVKVMICGTCTHKLLRKSIAEIPWDGVLVVKKPDEGQPATLRRRKGA